MRNRTADVIVVGAGATGGWAARHLTRRGRSVLLLEAGPRLNAHAEFQSIIDSGCLGQGQVVDNLDRIKVSKTTDDGSSQRVQATCYAYSPATSHLFVDDDENPYEVVENRPFHWIRMRGVGGRTNLWGRVAIRMSDAQFSSAHEAHPEWPLSYADLVAHYEAVESFTGVRGIPAGHPEVPDGNYVDAQPLLPSEVELWNTADELWPGAPRLMRLPTVRPTQEGVSLISRKAIPYFSSAASTIPAAESTGHLTVIPNAAVVRVLTNARGDVARAVQYVDTESGAAHEASARVIVLCASALESTRILLNSSNDAHPTGLGNSSGTLGRYLMDHAVGPHVVGRRPGSTESLGVSQGVYLPRLRFDAACGFGAQAHLRGSEIAVAGFGEMLPRFENHVSLSETVKDRWGIPALRIDCRHSDEEREEARVWKSDFERLLRTAGYEIVSSSASVEPPGSAMHEMGTARMGAAAGTSVLDANCRVWDVRNLFVTDGAAFVTSGYQNPTLTMMAITSRACDFIARHFETSLA